MDQPTYKKQLSLILEMNKLSASIKAVDATLEYADGQAYYKRKAERDEYFRKWSALWDEFQILTKRKKAPKPDHKLLTAKRALAASRSEEALKQAELARERDLAANKRFRTNLAAVNIKRKQKRKPRIMHTQLFYLCECGYATGQMLKRRNPDMRWDPYVQRWYFSVFMHGGMKFSPDEVTQNWILPEDKNKLAQEWSNKIKDELNNKPETERPYTVRIHGTATPKFWNK